MQRMQQHRNENIAAAHKHRAEEDADAGRVEPLHKTCADRCAHQNVRDMRQAEDHTGDEDNQRNLLFIAQLPFQIGERQSAEDHLFRKTGGHGNRDDLQIECLREIPVQKIRQTERKPVNQDHRATSQRPP